MCPKSETLTCRVFLSTPVVARAMLLVFTSRFRALLLFRFWQTEQLTLLYDVKGKRIEYSGQHFALLTAFGKI